MHGPLNVQKVHQLLHKYKRMWAR